MNDDAPVSSGASWDRMAGEPALWYDRFEGYRLIGPARSIEAAHRLVKDAGNLRARRVPTIWHDRAREWSWQRRAEAWDEVERARVRVEDEQRRRDAREERIELLQSARAAAWKGIEIAKIEELGLEDARSMLGSLRLLLFEALKGERLELGLPTEILAESDSVEFRADELARAQSELQAWREEQRESNG